MPRNNAELRAAIERFKRRVPTRELPFSLGGLMVIGQATTCEITCLRAELAVHDLREYALAVCIRPGLADVELGVPSFVRGAIGYQWTIDAVRFAFPRGEIARAWVALHAPEVLQKW